MEPMELEDRVLTNTRVAGGTTGVDAKGDVIAGRDIINNVSVTHINPPPTQVDPIKPFKIVAPPIHTFEGRQELLTEVHESLQERLRQKHYTKRIVALVGIGGMGKTETARKLVEKYDSFYENVAWIDSETESSAKESFLELSQELGLSISPAEEGKQLAKTVYRHLMKHNYKSPLFIFDNVNQLHSEESVFGIFDFLPTDRTGNLPLILITSQTSEWINYDCKVLQVGELSKTESLEILHSRFKLKPEELSMKKGLGGLLEQLNDKLEGYPLAVGLAAANISYSPGQDSLSLLKQNVKQYIQCVDSIDFFQQRVDINLATEYPHSLLKVWSIAMNNLERRKHAREARHLLWILAVCPQELLKEQRVARMYRNRCEALGMTFPAQSDATFEAAAHELQNVGIMRLQQRVIKIHRFIQFLSRWGDGSFFGVRKLLLYFDIEWAPSTDGFYDTYVPLDDSIPSWALQNEPTAILWLHSLKTVSREMLTRFLQTSGGPLHQLLQFPNGFDLMQVGQFLITVYLGIQVEPALESNEYLWRVLQSAVELKASLRTSPVEMRVILELLILFAVDKFVNAVIEAMGLESYEPAHADLPREVLTSLRQWLCEFDYFTAAHANLPSYLFDDLMSSLVENLILLQKSSILHREGIQIISLKMLFRLADARLLTSKETDKPYVSLELIEQLREICNPSEVEGLIKEYQLVDHLVRALTTMEPHGAICFLRQIVVGKSQLLCEAETRRLMSSIQAGELWKVSELPDPSPIPVHLVKVSPRLRERFTGIHGYVHFDNLWSLYVLDMYSIAVTCIAISLRKVAEGASFFQNLVELLPLEKYEHMERVMDAVITVEAGVDKYVDIGNFLRYIFPTPLLIKAELDDHKGIIQCAIQRGGSGMFVGLMQKLGKFNHDLDNCTPLPEQFVESDMSFFEGFSFSDSETASDWDTDTSSSDQSAS